MIVRHDFETLPPRMFLMQIIDNVSRLYCFLWDRKDEENTINLTWKELSKFFNKNSFKNNLRKLNNEGLLNYEESESGISIELVGWDEVDE